MWDDSGHTHTQTLSQQSYLNTRILTSAATVIYTRCQASLRSSESHSLKGEKSNRIAQLGAKWLSGGHYFISTATASRVESEKHRDWKGECRHKLHIGAILLPLKHRPGVVATALGPTRSITQITRITRRLMTPWISRSVLWWLKRKNTFSRKAAFYLSYWWEYRGKKHLNTYSECVLHFPEIWARYCT